MMHVNMLSGGKGSWAAGKLVAAAHGTAGLVHLFADTLWEDADLYRFLPEAVANVGGRFVRVCDGRTPWQVFRDRRCVGNARMAPCSVELKVRPCREWLLANADPAETVLHFGIGWHERHRLGAIRENWLPWRVEAPLCDPPHLADYEILQWLEREGIDPPRLYDEGAGHNNCGRRCVKQGQAGFRALLGTRPESFAECEREEEAMRAYLGKDVSILRDRRGGRTVPLPLAEFRRRVEAGEGCDLFDRGVPCQCFTETDQGRR
jgi:hypothetical protein